MKRRRRATLALISISAVGLPILSVPQVANAAPAGPDQPAPAGFSQALQPEVHEVTLITGDRVELTVHGPEGPYGTEVVPADRPGGLPVTFLTDVGPEGVYVVPSDVVSAVQSGAVDRELFNVTGLVELGYGDDASDVVPVIVTYPRSASSALRGSPQPSAAELAGRADRLPATSDAVGLASVNGAGVAVAKDRAGEFWQRLGTARVWLDGTAELVLDQSVPLVGAPQAWAAGYDGTGTTVAVLDTGVDLDHPDLAGRVRVAESFVEGLPAQDGHGHGTHVASTIAGSGAAAGGRYTGVAPGAELVSGRVCDDGGQCEFSDMIAGMEWAAQQMDADVVSFSISGAPSDGSDPLSQAVDTLTADTGTLFVIAAGNNGRDTTVGTPGTADAALTVAATDKADGLASFSSRGPRFRDLALKPDIAAPGVDIVAARAAGTSMGTPVDEHYTSASGTSMATPHVSGAAAILAQRYPDWTPAQLKAALMSTATDAGHTVYQQGAGRLDVARAATQPVHATTTNLDFGIVEIPDEGQPGPGAITKQVSYANQSGQPVTLTLTSSLTTTDGRAVPPGSLSAEPTVTVPASGVATVDVVLDVTGLGRGWYSGAVVATDEATGTRLTTPVGLVREPPAATLTIRTLGRDGQPVDPGGTQIIDVSGPGGFITDLTPLGEGVTGARLPEGVYSVAQLVSWVDEESRLNAAWLFNPELIVDGDTEIVLDARTATQITFDTPQASEPLSNAPASFYQRTTGDGQPLAGYVLFNLDDGGGWLRLWATPTEQVTVGGFRFVSQWTFGRNGMEMSVLGRPGLTLHPATLVGRDGGEQDSRLFRGTEELPLVDAGGGTPEELAGRDLTGKLALVEVPCFLDTDQIAAVREAGAAGIVAFPSAEFGCPIPRFPIVPRNSSNFTIGIRYAFLPSLEGYALRDLLADGPIILRIIGTTAESPYLNVLKPYEEGRVPDSLHYTFTEKDLAVTEVNFHASQSADVHESYYLWKQDDLIIEDLPVLPNNLLSAPGTRWEYVGPVAPDLLYQYDASLLSEEQLLEGRAAMADLLRTPGHTQEHWFAEPQTPGPAVTSEAAYATVDPEWPVDAFGPLGNPACALCREGNTLLGVSHMVTGSPDNQQHDGLLWISDDRPQYRLYRDGQEIPSTPRFWPSFDLPEDTGNYRLDLETPHTQASWWFTSGSPDEQAHQFGYGCLLRDFLRLATGPCAPVPAVFVSYDLGDSLALDNTVRARGVHKFDVYAYHHPSPAPMPAITGLKLWASYDGGERWTEVRVRDQGEGHFEAQLVHPRPDRRPSNQVSLKVEAWDADGNRIQQVTHDAFTLREVNTPEANVAS